MRDGRKALPPVFVVRQGETATTWVHLPHGDSARLWIELEDGGSRSDVAQVDRSALRVDHRQFALDLVEEPTRRVDGVQRHGRLTVAMLDLHDDGGIATEVAWLEGYRQ